MRWILAAVILFTTGQAMAQQIACGAAYTVRPGDTLQRIAVRAYGPDASWRTLWQVNADRLRGDPSLITVGDSVFVPCLDADGRPLPEVDVVAPATTETEADGTAIDAIRLRLVDAPGGGPGLRTMVVEALRRRYGAESVETTAAADAAPQVGAASLAVVRPACSDASRQTVAACEDLVWSVPLREIVLVVLTQADAAADPRATRSLCLQNGLPQALAAEMGFAAAVAESGTFSASACLSALAEGQVAVAIVEASAAEAETRRAGLGAALVEHTALARSATLHVAARADDPVGAAAVVATDAALGKALHDPRQAAAARAALSVDMLSR